VNKPTNAVGITAPGEGSPRLPRARTGEGCVAKTPHPFEVVDTPLCPLPQGARARKGRAAHFGETNPTNPTWVVPAKAEPITTVFGYGSRLSLRSAGTTIFHKNGEPTCGCGNRSLVRLACSGLLFTGNAATPTCRAVSARSGRRPARARRDGRALTPRRARAARRARRDGPRSPLESRNRARPAEGCREFRPPCSRW